MSKAIIGMYEALEEARKVGLGNMQISAQLVIEMAEYIYQLEIAEHAWETTMMRLVGEDGLADVEKAINKLKSQNQQKTLDQLAMAALPGLVTVRHFTCIDAAMAAYNYAEAMLEESQKRQGGAA